MMERAADVIIVGGGFMGAATAFFLRRRGRSVILLERGLVGQQASGVNFGNVRRQGRHIPQLPLANRSRAIWGQLRELIGEDVEFLPTGHLRVGYRDEHVAAMEAYRDASDGYGLDLELLSANALRQRFPFLGPAAIVGSYAPHDGHANPRLAAPAFARAARRAGAEIVENAEVVSVAKSAEDFVVETKDGGRYRAPALQVSAGAWGNRLSAQFGEPVPLAVKGPQMAVTEAVPYALTPVLGVATKDVREVIYLRQIPRGNVILGGTGHGPADPDTVRALVDPAVTLHQFTQLVRMVPALAALRIIRVWSGIEGYMPDDVPVMGPSAKVSGLFHAFGFCGAGFQLGPGVGDVMAELIDTGATSTPIAAFSIARFAGG